MIQQFLLHNGRKLFLTKRITEAPGGVVVMLPGLGYSRNEYAYFYSRLARSLCNNIVIQLDYTGHGDSDGDFSDATVPTLIEDVRFVLGHCKDCYPGLPLTVISRGIGTWITPYCIDKLDRWIVWNPVLTIPYHFIENILNRDTQNDFIEISDLPCASMPAEARLFFQTWGSDWWNVLRGERFSRKQLESFRTLAPDVLREYMNRIERLSFIYGSQWKYMNHKAQEKIICPGEEDFIVSPSGQDWAIDNICRLLSPSPTEL